MGTVLKDDVWYVIRAASFADLDILEKLSHPLPRDGDVTDTTEFLLCCQCCSAASGEIIALHVYKYKYRLSIRQHMDKRSLHGKRA